MTATSQAPRPGRPLTGRAVLIWLLAFFGITFAVNGVFIYLALSTFPGVEVASSYKAGQEFEADIAAGKAQATRAWQVDAAVRPVGAAASVDVTFRDKAGVPLTGLAVDIRLTHIADPRHDHAVTLTEGAAGAYRAEIPGVEAGIWNLVIAAHRDGERLFLSRNQLQFVR